MCSIFSVIGYPDARSWCLSDKMPSTFFVITNIHVYVERCSSVFVLAGNGCIFKYEIFFAIFVGFRAVDFRKVFTVCGSTFVGASYIE